jgi:CRP/FNR family cyclic AMP-dependent transcriptional regulator
MHPGLVALFSAIHLDPVALFREAARWDQVPALLGALFGFLSLRSTTMIPLRAFAIASNICFIGYSIFHLQYPMLAMHAVLLPVNAFRLYQMHKLVKRVRTAVSGDHRIGWLEPYMRRRQCHAGQVLFRAGNVADRLFYIVSGRFRVTEIDVVLPPGELVGEFGMLAPDGRRRYSLECIADGDLLSIGYDRVKQLYFQDREFGFFLLRLVHDRMSQNIEKLERQLNEARAAAPSRVQSP